MEITKIYDIIIGTVSLIILILFVIGITREIKRDLKILQSRRNDL